MSSGGARVSIPSSVRKMIHNIKEITGSHSEEEIYAMLKECSMDPNETAQKLLLQGSPFSLPILVNLVYLCFVLFRFYLDFLTMAVMMDYVFSFLFFSF